MEFLMELVLELLFEGSVEASRNKNLPKPVRYLAGGFIAIWVLAIISVIFLLGMDVIKENRAGGITLIAVSLAFTVFCVLKFRKVYLSMKTGRQEEL